MLKSGGKGMKIIAMEDGALMIETTEALIDERGRKLSSPFYLCRCGASRAKPYCDGSHRALGFKADGHRIEGSQAKKPSSPN